MLISPVPANLFRQDLTASKNLGEGVYDIGGAYRFAEASASGGYLQRGPSVYDAFEFAAFDERAISSLHSSLICNPYISCVLVCANRL